MGMQQGTWQDPESAWYRQPVAEDAPWWAQMAGSDPLMSIPGAQALRGAGQQLMGERAGRALTGLGQLFMPGAMASQNIRQGDYGAAGVDMGLDMLPLGGLVGRGLRGGRTLVGRAAGGLGAGATDLVNRFNYPHRTPYGYQFRGMMDPAEYTSPVRQEGTDRLVVGRRNIGTGDMPRMYATDQYGMNFRPVDYFSAGGSPQRMPGGGTNYGGSMAPGDQEFMDMLNSRYTFGSGVNPSLGWFGRTPGTGRTGAPSDFLGYTPQTIAEGMGAGRLANTLRRTEQSMTSPVDLNRMRGMSPQFQAQNLYGAGFRSVAPPPSAIPDTRNMGSVGQALTGGNLGMAPAVARTARGDMEEQFQQQPDLAGQLRRNVRARGGTTGRRGRGTGDTGG